MKIALICNDGSPLGVTPPDIYGRGVGGAELAMMSLTKTLAKRGHDVTIYNDTRFAKDFDGVHYGHRNNFNPMEPRDAIIVYRSPNALLGPRHGAKRVVWWSCDQYTVGNYPALATRVDAIVCISKFHLNYFSTMYGIDRAKMTAIDLGVRDWDYPSPPPERIKNRLIFMSIPDRGLRHLKPIYDQMRASIPDLSLTITSDYRLWGVNANNMQHRLMWAGTPGVEFLGAIPRAELCRLQMQAEMMIYPCVYEELFCLSVAEAQFAGAFPITTNTAALESTNEWGIQFDGVPGAPDFANAVAERAIDLLTTERNFLDASRKKMMALAAKRFNWDHIAEEWEAVLSGEKRP
jgi:glycosyltransferase involved in cell wall biosynthesis